ncbi:MAG TPA: carbohydrate kinase family protein [Streptosporangiaceae bacterium]|nr:carbohydrate kinase family protein [Streptosporangiaceae bacterium]
MGQAVRVRPVERAGQSAGGPIGVLGDAHLDVIVALTGQLAADTDTPARTSISVGGQAANVAAWVAALGGRSRLIAARATDLAASLVSRELSSRGVELVGPVIDGTTGVVVALSDGGSQRSMLTDRGVGARLAPDLLDTIWVTDCSWLHLPAYSLTSEPVGHAALAAAAAAKERSVRLSVDLSSVAALAAFGVAEFRDLITRLRPDVVFGNKAETTLAGDLPGVTVISKLGPDGVMIGGRHYPALPTEPLDATGAGDAFAAGYLVGGVALGLKAAARAVATMGAMP